eukprot:2767165-Pleurochrysis_carterae.AAC.5
MSRLAPGHISLKLLNTDDGPIPSRHTTQQMLLRTLLNAMRFNCRNATLQSRHVQSFAIKSRCGALIRAVIQPTDACVRSIFLVWPRLQASLAGPPTGDDD